MDYNPQLTLHRRLLALSIADYLEKTGQPLASRTAPAKNAAPGVSLQSVLAEHGVHIHRSTLAKLADRDYIERTAPPVDSHRVAAALGKLGYWPPISDIEASLQRLPAFAGALDTTSLKTLQEIEGSFVCYQYASRRPGTILIGKTTIGPALPLGGALAEIYIRNTGSPANSNLYAGIAWADSLGNIYMLMRAPPSPSPTFILFDEIERPGTLSDIATINGTALGAARQFNRHLSAITLHRADYPDDDSPIEPDQHHRLPEAVRHYILLPLKNGPSNY